MFTKLTETFKIPAHEHVGTQKSAKNPPTTITSHAETEFGREKKRTTKETLKKRVINAR